MPHSHRSGRQQVGSWQLRMMAGGKLMLGELSLLVSGVVTVRRSPVSDLLSSTAALGTGSPFVSTAVPITAREITAWYRRATAWLRSESVVIAFSLPPSA